MRKMHGQTTLSLRKCSMTKIIGKELHFADTVHRYVSYDVQIKHLLGCFPQQYSLVVLYTGKTVTFCEVGTDSLIIIRINFVFDMTRSPTRNPLRNYGFRLQNQNYRRASKYDYRTFKILPLCWCTVIIRCYVTTKCN